MASPQRVLPAALLAVLILLLAGPASAQMFGPRTDFSTSVSDPRGVTQLADGRVLVVERTAGRISVYPAGGGARSDFATGLSRPVGVTQLADGRVLVAEYTAGRLSVIPAAGGARSDFATGLSGPEGVTQLADGRVLVGEYSANRVSVIPAAGGARSDFATGLSRPVGVMQLIDGRVLVAEYDAGRVSAYPAGGGARSDFATGFSNPIDITQLADGRVLVAEQNANRTIQFSPAGEAVAVTEARLFNPSAAQGDGAGYRLLGAPVTGLTVADLAALNLVQGVAAGANAATHPAQFENAAANLFTAYDGVSYLPPATTAEALAPGRGFYWYLYDRDIDAAGVPASFGTGTSSSRELTGAALAAFGPQAEADVTLSFADNAGNDAQMLANPFARPFAVSGITAAGGTLQGGAVQTYDPAGGGTYALRSGSDRLSPWQGAFGELVPATAGQPVVVTYAFASTDGNASPVFVGRSAPDRTAARAEAASVRFALAGTLASGALVRDEAAIVRFVDGAEAGWDALDASKLTPPAASHALVAPVTTRDGAAYRAALDSRPADAGASVPVAFTATEAGAFTLAWTADLPDNWSATLTDTQTGATTDLMRASKASFTTAAAQAWTQRFTLAVAPRGVVSAESGGAASVFALELPRPNPARGASAVPFSLAEAGAARLSVVDLLGREVAVLVDGEQAAGRHTATVDTRAFAPGVYVVRLVAGAETQTRRLVVVR